MREPLEGELHVGAGDVAQRPTRETRKPVRTARSEHVPSVIRVPVDALTTRDRLRRPGTASQAISPPPSLAPQEVPAPRSSRLSSVFAFLGFLLGFAVALAWVEWMHRASLTAMRDAAMLRDPSRP